jgi:hypothetical protein
MQTAAIAQVYSKNITEISAQFSQLKYAKLQFYLKVCESWLLTLKAEHEVIINIFSKICTL